MCTREIQGEAAEFGTSGYTMDHVFVLYDRTHESVWYPLTDGTVDAVAGELRGDSIPFLDKPAPTPLGTWLAEHPDSTVLLPSEQDARRIQRAANRPVTGFRTGDTDAGISVTNVMAGGPAEAAGLRTGDVVRAIDGHLVDDRRDLTRTMFNYAPGDTVELTIERDGKEMTLSLTFGRR